MDQTHKISLWSAVLMNINIMVGIGIYILPTMMAQKAGYASFLGWPALAIVVLPIVLSIAALARMFPGAGSFYSYAKNIIGPKAGFFSGWSYYLGYTGVASFMAICLRDDVALHYIPINPILFNLLFVIFISLVSLLSIKTIGRIQSAGTIFKILPMVFVLAVFWGYWNPGFHLSLPDLANVPSLIPAAIFGYWGFESCTTISHLIKGDERNASRAMLIAFFAIVVLYSMFHLGVLHIMGASGLAAAGSPREFVYFLGLSPYLQAFITSSISIIIALVFINAVLGIFTATTSMLHTMANEGILPYTQQLTKQNRNQRPWMAIIIQGVLIFVITCSTNNKQILVSIINIGILLAFLLALVALYTLQKRAGQTKKIWLTVIAFVSWAFCSYYSWLDIGPTNLIRITISLPLIAAFVIGFAMYSYKKKSLPSR